MIALDIETTGLNPHTDTIIGVAIADATSESWIEDLSQLSGFTGQLKILHNFKFDYRFLHKYGINYYNTPTVDTIVLHHLLDENKPHDLGFVIKDVLGIDTSYKDEFWDKYKTAEEAPRAELVKYALQDARYTYDVYTKLCTRTNPKLVSHVMNLAMELGQTEANGICVDMQYVTALGVDLKKKILDTDHKLKESLSEYINEWELKEWLVEMQKRKTEKGKDGVKRPVFNFASGKQLGELLYDVIGLPEQKNKGNKRTVDDAALTNLKHPSVELLRDNREHNKLYGTYIEGVISRVVCDKIYPTFNVCGTVTGRISHKDPNMGNMPRQGNIRGMFVPKSGHCFISADYSQLEIVLAAHFSRDKALVDTILAGNSVHDLTANTLGCDRNKAKTLNFGILYGASKYKVKEIFACSDSEAEDIITRFFKAFPGLHNIINECHKRVERNQVLTNPFGRTRTFKGQWNNKWELERCKRQAFNFLIQSTGADICNRAFYKYAEGIRSRGNGRALFTVHDEIIAEVKKNVFEVEYKILGDTMVEVGKEIELLLPLAVDISKPLERWEK